MLEQRHWDLARDNPVDAVRISAGLKDDFQTVCLFRKGTSGPSLNMSMLARDTG
jgi:hypothetical protein